MEQANNDNVTFYMGNPHLKAANVKMTYTEDQIKEVIKCAEDPIYFIENYVKIVTVDEGLVQFKLWDFQKNLIHNIVNNRFTIAKLPRQVGKSTTTVSYLLWVVLFQPQQSIAILANKSKTAMSILGRLQTAYEHIPHWMQQGIKAWNKGNIELENGSKIIAASTTEDSVRGDTYNIIFLDEFAFVPHNVAEEFITSVYPTITSGKSSKIIIVSTPKGMNLFYKYWTDAINKKNLYVPIQVHWSDVPGRDKAWAEEQEKQLGKEKFNQEFNCEFLGSSDTLIASSKLATMAWIEPQYNKHSFKVYEAPQEDRSYMITVDTGRGDNLNYSAFSVFDVTAAPYKQVAQYRNCEISPMLYPNIIHNVAFKYNKAFILVETNDIGAQVADTLFHELEYEHIFCTITMGRGGQKIALGMRKNGKLGVKTSAPMKSIGCSNLKSLLEGDQLIIQDFDTISELTTFVLKKKSYEAEEGRNDDLAMTLVMFAWLCAQPMFKEMTDINIQKRLFEEREKMTEETMLPFGYFNSVEEKEDFVDESGTRWEFVPEIEQRRKEAKWWKDVGYTLEDEDDEPPTTL